MTFPKYPAEGELVDVMAVDREIEALRAGVRKSDDPALRRLIDLRDDVDSRTAALVGARGLDESVALPEPIRPPAGHRNPAPAAPRRWRRQRLVVVPIAGALVLASTGVAAALSGSRHAPFYPLHRLIFGPAPSSDGQLSRDLAAAQQLLDQAATQPLQRRAGSLAHARMLLSTALTLLPIASSDSVRTTLSREIDAALARASRLAVPPRPPAPLPLPAPSREATQPGGEPEPAEPSDSQSEPAAALGPPQSETEIADAASPAGLPIEWEAAPPAARDAPATAAGQEYGYSPSTGAPPAQPGESAD